MSEPVIKAKAWMCSCCEDRNGNERLTILRLGALLRSPFVRLEMLK